MGAVGTFVGGAVGSIFGPAGTAFGAGVGSKIDKDMINKALDLGRALKAKIGSKGNTEQTPTFVYWKGTKGKIAPQENMSVNYYKGDWAKMNKGVYNGIELDIYTKDALYPKYSYLSKDFDSNSQEFWDTVVKLEAGQPVQNGVFSKSNSGVFMIAGIILLAIIFIFKK
jgi:hypothetical protein